MIPICNRPGQVASPHFVRDGCATNPQNATILANTHGKAQTPVDTNHRSKQDRASSIYANAPYVVGRRECPRAGADSPRCRGRHRFPSPPNRPKTAGMPRALPNCSTTPVPNALINLAYYFDWFQAETVSESRLAAQESAIERLAELCSAPQHHLAATVQLPRVRWLPRHCLQRERTSRCPWACAARRCGVSNRACAPPARSMCCCALAGCWMTVSTAPSGVSWRGPSRLKNC